MPVHLVKQQVRHPDGGSVDVDDDILRISDAKIADIAVWF